MNYADTNLIFQSIYSKKIYSPNILDTSFKGKIQHIKSVDIASNPNSIPNKLNSLASINLASVLRINKSNAVTFGDKYTVPDDDRKWWKEAVIYQIYPMSFKDTDGDGFGDIKGVISKLDYLQKLGANTIWLNPVYKSPEVDNGYDISNYEEINPRYGSIEDIEKLIQELHKRDMKLVMDLVVNHTSEQHSWFIASKDPAHPEHGKYKDFYIWRPPSGDGKISNPADPEEISRKVPNGQRSVFGGSAWEYVPERGEYYLHLFAKEQPDLNWENKDTRQEIYGMMRRWLNKGVDGFRMDVINYIAKPKDFYNPAADISGFISHMNEPRMHEFLQEMNREVLSRYPNAMTVGECPGSTIASGIDTVGKNRDELNMIFTFEHVSLDCEDDKGKWVNKKVNLSDLKDSLTRWQTGMEEGNGWNSIYLMNHDQPRAVSRFGNDSTPEFRDKSAKLLATLNLTLKGTPYIYMGEEMGMTNCGFDDIHDYRDVETLNYYEESRIHGMPEREILEIIKAKGRDNSRTPFQWDSSKNAGFTEGNQPWIRVNPNYTEINLDKAENDQNSIFHYYQRMIKLRQNNDVLLYGKYDVLSGNDPKIYAYTRTLDNKKILVVLNFSRENTEFSTQENKLDMENAKLLIGNYSDSCPGIVKGQPEKLSLKPYEARVYELCA